MQEAYIHEHTAERRTTGRDCWPEMHALNSGGARKKSSLDQATAIWVCLLQQHSLAALTITDA